MLRLRLAHADDAAAIAAIYAPCVLHTAISFELAPPSPAEIAERMARGAAYAPWLVATRGDDVVGYAYAGRYRERLAYQWSVEASVYVRADHQRGGVGRALYASLFALLRVQGFYTVFAGITLPNPASVAIHEALGFAPVGVYRCAGYKHGAWRDVGWWQLALRERTGEPAPPLSTADAQRQPGWSAALDTGLAAVRR
jgi:phosphinothricin acetyltransferase